MKPVFRPWFTGWLLVFALGALPSLAWGDVEDARKCTASGGYYGLECSRQQIQMFDTKTMAPVFTEQKLLLLGGDSSRYVLFDCQSHTILHIPVAGYVVVQSGR